MGISLPTFFFATILKLIFAVQLKWFDVSGLMGRNYAQLDAMGKVLDMAHHLVLPIVTLTIVSVGSLMRYTRTNMLEVLNADYIRTARAKGLSEKKVIYHHAFRNTLIPLVTMVGGSLPGLFSAIPIPDPDAKMNRIVLEGSIPSPANPPSGCKFHTRCANCMERCKVEAPEQKEIEPGHYVVCHLYDK